MALQLSQMYNPYGYGYPQYDPYAMYQPHGMSPKKKDDRRRKKKKKRNSDDSTEESEVYFIVFSGNLNGNRKVDLAHLNKRKGALVEERKKTKPTSHLQLKYYPKVQLRKNLKLKGKGK